MFKVLITDKINKTAGDILSEVADVTYMETLPEDKLCEIIGEYDGFMVRSQTKVTKNILEAAKKMKIVGRAGVGVDNIDIEEATQKGIIVVNSPDGNTTAAAEHTIALMLSMARHIPQAATSTKEGKWERSKFTGIEVFNKTLGIIGLGKIGMRVANAALGLGMKVLVYDPFTTRERVEDLGGTYVSGLEEFWPICDFITVHVPKTKDTLNLINKDTIAKMKDSVRIINCARGGIVNEQDLKDALENGTVAAAAVDVFEKEPIVAENPLLHCNGNLTITPHLGASTEEAQINVALDVAEQIRDVLMGKSARSAVNIPSLKAELLEPVKEYMGLAENLGALVGQLAKGALTKIDITVKGNLAKENVSPLKVAVLKGVLAPTLQDVNYVNAPVIANNRGIQVTQTKNEGACNYAGLITVTICTENNQVSVSGAMIAENTPRIVSIDNYNTSIEPAEHILIAPHLDQPGMIAKVASVLGNNNINISMMQVARKDKSVGGQSTMIMNTDEALSESILEQVKKIDGVYNASYVNLKPETIEQRAKETANI